MVQWIIVKLSPNFWEPCKVILLNYAWLAFSNILPKTWKLDFSSLRQWKFNEPFNGIHLNHWVKWIDCQFSWGGTLMKNAFSFCVESEQYSDTNHLTRPKDWAYHIFSVESIASLLYLYLLCFIISGWVHFQLSKYIINHFYGVAPSKRTLTHCTIYFCGYVLFFVIFCFTII